MKANELMIGDIVSHNGIPVKIEVIAGMYSYVVPVKDNLGYLNKGFEVDNDELTPILITPEILEKNGFVWNTYHNSLQLVCGSTHIGWGFYPNCLSVSDWEDDAENQISSLGCNYVHELQHALRLCGIEKEIII